MLDAKVYPPRKSAVCAAHARRYFQKLSRGGSSASQLAIEAMRRWARIYHAEAALREMDHEGRRQARQRFSKPLWNEFEVWLKLQRTQVLDGSKIAEAIDYNLIERQIKPWKLGAMNWLLVASKWAGQRAAVVMSLVQSAKLNGHEPWAYLKDGLTRLPTQLNSRIEELLPHKWQPAG